jgi:hypothetical protein
MPQPGRGSARGTRTWGEKRNVCRECRDSEAEKSPRGIQWYTVCRGKSKVGEDETMKTVLDTKLVGDETRKTVLDTAQNSYVTHMKNCAIGSQAETA